MWTVMRHVREITLVEILVVLAIATMLLAQSPPMLP
jgi:hypothetical protein